METYVLNLWTWFFTLLRYLTPYFWVNRLPTSIVKTSGFSDSWVLGYSLLAIVFVILIPIPNAAWYGVVALILGGLRVLEIVGYLFNILLLSTNTKNSNGTISPLHSARRSLVLAMHNYVEIVLWFAITYSVFEERFLNSAGILSTSMGSVYFSVVTMTTLGYGDVTLNDTLTRLLVTLQTAIGLFMVLVVFGWIIGLLPKRESSDI